MRIFFGVSAAAAAMLALLTVLAPAPVLAQELCNPVLETDGDAVTDRNGAVVRHAGTVPCPEEVVDTPPPPAIVEPTTITLSADVLFDFDRATLRPEAQAELDQIIPVIAEGSASIEVAGHTDSIGTEQYNQDLSQRRAQSVVDYLVANGIQRQRLIARGFGESRPVAPNQTAEGQDNPEGRQLNRRVEITTIVDDPATS